jgi:hypothetical protein
MELYRLQHESRESSTLLQRRLGGNTDFVVDAQWRKGGSLNDGFHLPPLLHYSCDAVLPLTRAERKSLKFRHTGHGLS